MSHLLPSFLLFHQKTKALGFYSHSTLLILSALILFHFHHQLNPSNSPHTQPAKQSNNKTHKTCETFSSNSVEATTTHTHTKLQLQCSFCNKNKHKTFEFSFFIIISLISFFYCVDIFVVCCCVQWNKRGKFKKKMKKRNKQKKKLCE